MPHATYVRDGKFRKATRVADVDPVGAPFVVTNSKDKNAYVYKKGGTDHVTKPGDTIYYRWGPHYYPSHVHVLLLELEKHDGWKKAVRWWEGLSKKNKKRFLAYSPEELAQSLQPTDAAPEAEPDWIRPTDAEPDWGAEVEAAPEAEPEVEEVPEAELEQPRPLRVPNQPLRVDEPAPQQGDAMDTELGQLEDEALRNMRANMTMLSKLAKDQAEAQRKRSGRSGRSKRSGAQEPQRSRSRKRGTGRPTLRFDLEDV